MQGMVVTKDYLPLLGLKTIAGRGFEDSDFSLGSTTAILLGDGFRLIAAGVVVGVALAMIVSRVLRSFLFEVQPGDPATFVFVGLLFLGVALLACWAGAACREGRSLGGVEVQVR